MTPPQAAPPFVLVVEDDPYSRRALVKLCRAFGVAADGVATVAEALAAVARDPAPGFVVLDLMLPDGNGTEVLRLIRSAGLPTRVAVATGTHDPAMLAGVQALHPELLMHKPLNVDELHRWLTSR